MKPSDLTVLTESLEEHRPHNNSPDNPKYFRYKDANALPGEDPTPATPGRALKVFCDRLEAKGYRPTMFCRTIEDDGWLVVAYEIPS